MLHTILRLMSSIMQGIPVIAQWSSKSSSFAPLAPGNHLQRMHHHINTHGAEHIDSNPQILNCFM